MAVGLVGRAVGRGWVGFKKRAEGTAYGTGGLFFVALFFGAF